jgi:hypothetical protein
MINSFIGKLDDFMELLFMSNPIEKQPIILTNNVPTGNLLINKLLNGVAHKYRNIDPMNPPIPIDNNCFNII